ncbi:ERF family protein, partial [Mesorhizobium sp. BR1-1-7]|uniref:ERF family protein n=1 Tax=Mesorhizobium sp. BR1-1-7 TaxID=2876647 RepID=UPI001CCADD2E
MNTVANALVEHEPTQITPVRSAAPGGAMTPMEMAYHLIQNGADLGSVKEMLAMSKELAADQARMAFEEAVALAKAEIGPVTRNAKGHNDKRYADFAAYARAVDPIITKYGLSYRFRTTQADRITVTCILAHKAGHFEENDLSGPADTSGSKNAIQAIGSTLTYLQRYSLIQALGLSASNDDDGKAGGIAADGGLITTTQRDNLLRLIDETGTDVVKFCEWAKVEAVADLLDCHYDKAVGVLEQRKA